MPRRKRLTAADKAPARPGTAPGRHRTMDDLAGASGVSRPTLSKFFDNPDSVRPGTRSRIEAALAASDYRPNLFARNLNRKRTNAVGIVVPTIADMFHAEMIRRLELALRDAGFWPISMSSHGSAELEADAVRTMVALKVAGAIVAPLGPASDPAALAELARAAPVVLYDAMADAGLPFVGNDNVQSMATMVGYLCRTGDAPAYLDIPHVSRNAIERATSYEAAMRALGHEPIIVAAGSAPSWSFEQLGFERMRALLAGGGLPGHTLLCANDRLAFGVMAALDAAGLRVGRQAGRNLRLAGHDDHPLSRYACPSLTTMAQDYAGMAANAVGLLMDMMRDRDAPSHGRAGEAPVVRLPATLVMRNSA